MNIWDILLLAAIGTALFLAVRALIRRKSCGCTGFESCDPLFLLNISDNYLIFLTKDIDIPILS